MASKLKPKEQLFCFYYAKLQNSKEAAIKSGFSSFAPEMQGDKLLQRKDISDEINRLCRQQEYDDLLQSVIAGLKRLAFSNVNDSIKLVLKEKENLESLIDSLDLFSISEIKIPKDNSIEIKFFDRFKAFDKLIELVNSKNGKQDASEFYKALEKGASLISKEGNINGV